MTRATLARTAELVLGSEFVGERITVVWHAGEPLVLPIAYYRDAFKTFADATPAGVEVTHSFQTNGTLINRDWAKFFAESDARIGISIDGPAEFHDRYRRGRNGRSTHAATLAGIRQLQRQGIDFHVITVLTAEALEEPDAFIDFFLKENIRQVGFNVEEIEGSNNFSSLERTNASSRYVDFMWRVLGRVGALPPGKLTVRELRDTFSLIADADQARRHNEQVEPLGIISVDVNGNISTFSPELLGAQSRRYGDFNFGNVHHNTLNDVLTHPAFLRVEEDIRTGVRHCSESCAYFTYCKGGAPSNKFFENGSFASTETLYCRLTKKALFDVVLDHLESALDIESK